MIDLNVIFALLQTHELALVYLLAAAGWFCCLRTMVRYGRCRAQLAQRPTKEDYEEKGREIISLEARLKQSEKMFRESLEQGPIEVKVTNPDDSASKIWERPSTMVSSVYNPHDYFHAPVSSGAFVIRNCRIS